MKSKIIFCFISKTLCTFNNKVYYSKLFFSLTLTLNIFLNSCNFENKHTNLTSKIKHPENNRNELDKAVIKIKNKKRIISRNFFYHMDSLSKYHCICSIPNKYKDTFDISIYLSTNKLDSIGRSYFWFNIFLEDDYLKDAKTYAMLIGLKNDTLVIKKTENYVYFNKLYRLDHISKEKILVKGEIPFLIFNLDSNIKYKIKNNLYLIDSIQILSKQNIENVFITHFKNFDYDTITTHIPFIEDMFVSLEYGILGFKYYAGNYDYDCWIK